ncbi:MAG: hypothetical protein PUG26_06900 [Oscillospiraceae bacterium]|nr:hypothetical protein [Oscillospiraceae bacterium]MDD6356047.1 hypothetical protein [Oscillospiraceae bacterium]
MRFSDFVGNEKVKQLITYQAESGRLPHAIIIEGEEGLGKRTFAREIALNLLCRSDDPPCRSCAQCSKMLHGVHPDVYEYSASGAPQSFKVKQIRDIIDDVYVSPNEADYKIYILGNCQGMNASAQNALLKILEEPPSYVIFILTVTNKAALLPTVLSRCVTFTLEGVERSLATQYVCEHTENADESAVRRLADVFDGNIGKMLESVEDGKLGEISGYAESICSALLADNEYELLKACSVFRGDRNAMLSTLELLKTVFRDALVYSDGSAALSGMTDSVKMLASRLNKMKLISLINSSDNLRLLAAKNGNNAILITKICYDFRRAVGR